MHSSFQTASRLTEIIIGAAIEVHRDKGPGLIESIYEWCLMKEFELRELTCVSQKRVIIEYKGFTREEPLRFDMLVEGCVLVEAKAVEKILPIHKAQLLSYMKLLNIPIGLLINFHEMKIRFQQSKRVNGDGKQRDLPFLCYLLLGITFRGFHRSADRGGAAGDLQTKLDLSMFTTNNTFRVLVISRIN